MKKLWFFLSRANYFLLYSWEGNFHFVGIAALARLSRSMVQEIFHFYKTILYTFFT